MALVSKRTVIDTIIQHIPSLSDEADAEMDDRFLKSIDSYSEGLDFADLAIRTCACGARIDGFYAYVDHLISTFGGESHYAS